MQKSILSIGCVVGGGLIGFFASQLNTIVGCICFALGVSLLAGTIVFMNARKDNK